MRAVNLLPRDTVKQRRITQQNLPIVVGGGLGVIVVGALAMSFLNAAGAVSAAQTQLNDVSAQLAATPRPVAPARQANSQLVGEQSARVIAVSTAIGGRIAWDRILREFSLVLPDDVWISSLSLTPEAGLAMSGTTYSHESVARLLSRLALIPELNTIVLASSNAGGGAPPAAATTGKSATPSLPAPPVTVTFSITAKVTLPAGAATVSAPPPAPTPPASTSTSTTTTTG